MTALLRAIATGDPSLSYRAFFPLAAYVQTKWYSDAAEDWHDRLLAGFDADVVVLHGELGQHAAAARLVRYSVDDPAAVWVLPGVEDNKSPYWRVYDTTLTYRIGPGMRTIAVTTMISCAGASLQNVTIFSVEQTSSASMRTA